MTTHTWKCRSHFPTSWSILWTRHEKGCLCMRSSVPFWNCQISWRTTVLGWYFWDLLSMPAFKNSFVGPCLPLSAEVSFWLAPPLLAPRVLTPQPSVSLRTILVVSASLLISLPTPSFCSSCLGKGASAAVWASVLACAWVLAQHPFSPPLGVILVHAMLEWKKQPIRERSWQAFWGTCAIFFHWTSHKSFRHWFTNGRWIE